MRDFMQLNGITITILSDNHCAEGWEAEHGLSFWIESAGVRTLFDTGCGEVMFRNAAALGADIALADCVVLSHGHYDHTGNLAKVLECAGQARLYLHPDAVKQRYSIHDAPRAIGMPEEAAACLGNAIRADSHGTQGVYCSLRDSLSLHRGCGLHVSDERMEISCQPGYAGMRVRRLTETVRPTFLVSDSGCVRSSPQKDQKPEFLNTWIAGRAPRLSFN